MWRWLLAETQKSAHPPASMQVLELNGTQHNGLNPKRKDTKAIVLDTLEVQESCMPNPSAGAMNLALDFAAETAEPIAIQWRP